MPKCAVLRIPEVEPEPTFSYPEGLWKGDGQGACRTSALENSKVLYGNFSGSTCGMTQAPLARKRHLSLVPSKTENQDSAKVLPLFSKEPYRTFSGKELDTETGLYYFGARYYDPRTSVWESPDPVLYKYLPNANTEVKFAYNQEPTWKMELNFYDESGYPWRDGGVFNSANLALYTYVGNNPLIYSDPDGKELQKADLPGIKPTENYLDSKFAPMVKDWVAKAKAKGVELQFNAAFRPPGKQAEVKGDPSSVTPANPGSSLHEAGFAVDVNYNSLKSDKGGLTGDEKRKIILDTAGEAGLSWGGKFVTPKPDPPHFYYDPGTDRGSLVKSAQDQYRKLNAPSGK